MDLITFRQTGIIDNMLANIATTENPYLVKIIGYKIVRTFYNQKK